MKRKIIVWVMAAAVCMSMATPAAAASKKRLPLPFCGMLFTASLLTVYPSPLNLR